MNNNEVNLMDALYNAVEAVAGKAAADRLATLPKPKPDFDPTDWETAWENKMMAQFDYIPDRRSERY